MMHKGSKDTGPGLIAVDGNTLTYTVTLAELGLDPSLGDTEVHIWADTEQKGVQDRAPNTDATDGCDEPQNTDEVLTLPLIAVSCPCWDLTQLTADLNTYAAERSVPTSSLECTVVQNDASGIDIRFSPDITTIGPFGVTVIADDPRKGNFCRSHDGFDGPPPPDVLQAGITDAELQACKDVVTALATQEGCPGF